MYWLMTIISAIGNEGRPGSVNVTPPVQMPTVPRSDAQLAEGYVSDSAATARGGVRPHILLSSSADVLAARSSGIAIENEVGKIVIGTRLCCASSALETHESEHACATMPRSYSLCREIRCWSGSEASGTQKSEQKRPLFRGESLRRRTLWWSLPWQRQQNVQRR